MGFWSQKSLALSGASTVQLRPPNLASLASKDAVPNGLKQPPDYSYQLDYLRMTNGGVPKKLQPLPPPPTPATPGSPTAQELKEAAHTLQVACDNYRQHNLDPAVVRQIIGVNNLGDLTFIEPTAPATAPLIVNHKLRFRDPTGLQLFVDYAINMETVDSDHRPDPFYVQVTP